MRVNDVELNVVVLGEGPEVLLVHGFPDDHTVWRNQIPALVDAGYRVIALDTRGCGESEIKPREGDYAIDKLVADLVAPGQRRPALAVALGGLAIVGILTLAVGGQAANVESGRLMAGAGGRAGKKCGSPR